MNIKEFSQVVAIKSSVFIKVIHVFGGEYLHTFLLVTEYWDLG